MSDKSKHFDVEKVMNLPIEQLKILVEKLYTDSDYLREKLATSIKIGSEEEFKKLSERSSKILSYASDLKRLYNQRIQDLFNSIKK